MTEALNIVKSANYSGTEIKTGVDDDFFDIVMINDQVILLDCKRRKFKVKLFGAVVNMCMIYDMKSVILDLKDLKIIDNKKFYSNGTKSYHKKIFYLDNDDNIPEYEITVSKVKLKCLGEQDEGRSLNCMTFSIMSDYADINNFRSDDCDISEFPDKPGLGTVKRYFLLIFNLLNFLGFKGNIFINDATRMETFSMKDPYILTHGATLYGSVGFKPYYNENIINKVIDELNSYANIEIEYKNEKATIKYFINKYFFENKENKGEWNSLSIYLTKYYNYKAIFLLINAIFRDLMIDFKDWCTPQKLGKFFS